MTMGNHTFDKKELYDYIDEADKLIVPINQPKVLPGVKSRVFDVLDKKVRVTNVLGVAFMDSRNSNPFDVIDDYLDLQQDIHIIDFHGETTSEKIAFAQTADEKIIDGKVAFISDVGMTGPYMSAIGCDLDAIVTRLRGLGAPFIVAKSSGQLSGVIITFEENRPVEIERILINQDHPYN